MRLLRTSCLVGLAAALLAGVGATPAATADLVGAPRSRPVLATVPPQAAERWQGAYWGAGLAISAAGVDIGGVGKKDDADIEQGSAMAFANIGFNQVYGGWLVGIEADLGGATMDKTKAVSGVGDVEAKANVIGSVRGRFGYAWDCMLLYATAGVAFAHTEVNSSLGGRHKGVDVGAVVGLGAEVAVDQNWAVRGEALAYGFAADETTFGGTRRDLDFGMASLRLGAVRKF